MTILLQVLFILIMCLFHFIWVGCLAVCQTYQVVWLAMTTNERMNAARYRHFQRGEAAHYCRSQIIIAIMFQLVGGCTSHLLIEA